MSYSGLVRSLRGQGYKVRVVRKVSGDVIEYLFHLGSGQREICCMVKFEKDELKSLGQGHVRTTFEFAVRRLQNEFWHRHPRDALISIDQGFKFLTTVFGAYGLPDGSREARVVSVEVETVVGKSAFRFKVNSDDGFTVPCWVDVKTRQAP